MYPVLNSAPILQILFGRTEVFIFAINLELKGCSFQDSFKRTVIVFIKSLRTTALEYQHKELAAVNYGQLQGNCR